MGNGRNKDYLWKFDKKRTNGVLGNLGSHLVDIARWLIGDITSVTAQLGFSVNRQRADGGVIDPANDLALLLVRFADDAHGTILVSSVAYSADRGGHQEIRLYGEAGSLEIDFNIFGSEAGAVIQAARGQDELFHTLEVPDSYWGAADRIDTMSIWTKNSVGTRAFIDAILEDRPVEPNFYDGYKAQQVIDAALTSHEKGCAVSIDNSV